MNFFSKRKNSQSPKLLPSSRKIKLNESDNLETLHQMEARFEYFCEQSTRNAIVVKRSNSIRMIQSPQVSLRYFEGHNTEPLHQVVSHFSEQMISQLFKALITNQVKCLSSNVDQISTVTNILTLFGIRADVIVQLDEYDRRRYIIEKMNNSIEMLLAKWKQRKKEQQEPPQTNHQQRELYYWMQIDSKYKALKTKLKALVVSKMTEFENQDRLMHEHINLKGIKTSSTTEILIRMNSMLRFDSRNKNAKSILEIEWNDELEANFITNRNQARQKYAQISKSNFNQLGFLPLMKSLKIAENHNYLSSYELKFIIDTSELIANSVDRNYLQSMVNRVDKDQIQALESNLAEQIIENHEALNRSIRLSRFKYLQQRCALTKGRIQKHNQLEIYKNRLIKQHLAHLKITQRIRTHLSKHKHRNYFVILFAREIMRRILRIRERRPKMQLIVRPRSRSPQDSIRVYSSGPNQKTKIKNAIVKIQSLVRMFIQKRRYQRQMNAILMRHLLRKL